MLGRGTALRSGLSMGRISLVAGGISAGLLGLYIWQHSGGDEEMLPALKALAAGAAMPVPDHGSVARPPQPQPAAPPQPLVGAPPQAAPVQQPPPRPPRQPGNPKPKIWERVAQEGVGGYSNDKAHEVAAKREARVLEAGARGSDFDPVGSDCFIPPGTPINATLQNHVFTERAGIAVAVVGQPVMATNMTCQGIPPNSVLTMEYNTAIARGQKRI